MSRQLFLNGTMVRDDRDDSLFINGSMLTGSFPQVGRVLEAANSEYFIRASNADLQTGNVDFWVAGWMRGDGAATTILASMYGASGLRDWYVEHRAGEERLVWRVMTNATSSYTQLQSTAGTVENDVWTFFFAYHDATNDEAGLIIVGPGDAEDVKTGAITRTQSAVSPNFVVGSYSLGGSTYYDGAVGLIAFGKPPSTPTDWEDIWRPLYNQGADLPYDELSSAWITDAGLKGYWEMNEASGDALDSHTGGYDLTETGTIGSTEDGDVFTATATLIVGATTLAASGEHVTYHGATAALITGATTLEATGEFDAPVYTGTADLNVGATVLAAEATFAAEVYSGTADLNVGATTLAASAEFDVPVYTATADLVTGEVVLTASAEFDGPTSDSSGTADLVVGAAFLNANAEFDAPVYTGTADLVTGATVLAAEAAFAAEIYAGQADLNVGAATLAADAEFDAPVFSGEADLVVGPAELAASADVTNPTYSGEAALTTGAAILAVEAIHTTALFAATAALVTGPAELSASAEFDVPVYSGEASLTVAGAELAASAIGAAPTFTATAALSVGAAVLAAEAEFTPYYSATASLVIGAAELSATASVDLSGVYFVEMVTLCSPTLTVPQLSARIDVPNLSAYIDPDGC